MNLAWRYLAFASCTYVLGIASCGGKVRSDDPGGSAGADMGSTGAAGSGMATTASTTAGTTGSTTTGAGGGIDPGVNCESVCVRLVGTGCYPGDLKMCVQSCEMARAEVPQCASVFDQLLVCLETSPIGCGPGGSLQAPGCEPFEQKLEACRPTVPPPVFDAGPPSQCGGMVPPGPMACSGSGGGSAVTGGSGGQPTCISECTDGKNNTWRSNCVGDKCTCTYNGITYCTCVLAGPSCFEARGCCPGLP